MKSPPSPPRSSGTCGYDPVSTIPAMDQTIVPPKSDQPQEEPPAARRALLRTIVLLLVLAGAFALVYFSPVRAWLSDTAAVRRSIASLGPWAYPACILAAAVLVACGTPRLLIAA